VRHAAAPRAVVGAREVLWQTPQGHPFFGGDVPSTAHLPLLDPKPMFEDVGPPKPWRVQGMQAMRDKIAAAGEQDQSVLEAGLRILRLTEGCESWDRSFDHDLMLRAVLMPDATAASDEAVAAAIQYNTIQNIQQRQQQFR
jgi:hypothetical protein